MHRRPWISLVLAFTCVWLFPSAPADVPGLRYEHRSLAGPESIHILEVDPRQPELSVGIDLKELAELLLSLGCVDALNLDGGGSSTLLPGRYRQFSFGYHQRAPGFRRDHSSAIAALTSKDISA
jgi:hypothetical protein